MQKIKMKRKYFPTYSLFFGKNQIFPDFWQISKTTDLDERIMMRAFHPSFIHPVEIKANIQSKIPYLLLKMPNLEIPSDFDGRITIEHPIHPLIHSSIQSFIIRSVNQSFIHP
jgi:hypothetical protein